MDLTAGSPDIIAYKCNICGCDNSLESKKFHRELALCTRCGANARFRGIIDVLGTMLQESGELKSWQKRKEIRGIGMSDWDGYARKLSQKFSYQNTFYDRAPFFDIQNLNEDWIGKHNFIITTDVFEHILSPLQRAFDNLFALLCSGGGLVFSVPYTREEHTIEHFQGLCDYEFFDFHGEKVLINRDSHGYLRAYDGLVFHGGEGATLEMRLYCEQDIIERLKRAGFENIHVHDNPNLSIGYYWPMMYSNPSQKELHAYIISATKPES